MTVPRSNWASAIVSRTTVRAQRRVRWRKGRAPGSASASPTPAPAPAPTPTSAPAPGSGCALRQATAPATATSTATRQALKTLTSNGATFNKSHRSSCSRTVDCRCLSNHSDSMQVCARGS
eukprot:CAMPEP_0173243452 /NCGR_PEP_ID=MMETSP1142-20121109/15512_1 /TAXON_ID=483371 /ORGANISM="non described non described, Strain CCMP2298" /LENGTH=120 /DNA_ID=CAMNT_0014175051 /DNA_START=52 /DNA_END=414 /DNA_ORIENTATION=-